MKVDTNMPEFARTMRKYGAIYGQRHGKTLDLIILERAKKLAYELYAQTAAIAPDKGRIAADVQKLGWRIPPYFPDGRMGRGEPRMWADNAIDELPKRRGRKSKKRLAQEESIRNSKATLAQMQAFVIRRRASHAKFVATGWLRCILDLGGSLNKGSGDVNPNAGGAVIKPGEVELHNNTPGCVPANSKYGFVKKAIAAQIQDMTEYIVSRTQQARKAA